MIRVLPYDADLSSNDGLGAREWALETGETTIISAAEWTSNQVLLAQILVRPASTPIPGFSGTTFLK